jgi:hypothetical protein
MALGMLAVSVVAGPVGARAEREPILLEWTEVNQVVGTDCIEGDFAGTETLTFTVTGSSVTVGDDRHLALRQNLDVHTTFENGYEVVGAGHAQLMLQIMPFREVTFSFVVHEVHNIYDADGNLLSRAVFHDLSQLNYSDVNGNGEPDAGEIKVDLHRFAAKCV